MPESALVRAAAQVPALGEYLSGPFDLPASVMLDAQWMRERVREIGVRWGCSDARVNGTLWWYAASSTMAFVPIATALAVGEAADPRLDDARCFLRPDGSLGGVIGEATLDVEGLAAAMVESFGALVDAVSAASGARVKALWAIATDSIANRCLDVGAALGNRALGSEFAVSLIDDMRAPMPAPRFVDVAGRRFTERCSCCLLYETDAADKCTSCPRRTPDDRLRGLHIAARW
ncbi:(2Fe-2S)-binding protein [Rhodococcoides yunnanense]|uniref:(2Fe-2S)-binding protein n=1 Tax=Rhodococcoides yunnanense TaxID=278209 RepID=UPI00093451B0|nr:(2Fe-2S)-binding protein [Rhodococcus yunnanensis]